MGRDDRDANLRKALAACTLSIALVPAPSHAGEAGTAGFLSLRLGAGVTVVRKPGKLPA